MIFTGSIVKFGVMEYWSRLECWVRTHHSDHSSTPCTAISLPSHRAFPRRDMRFELVAVLSDKRSRRHRRGIAKRTDRIAGDIAG